MAQPCEHLSGLSPGDFPPQKTPDACEECLKEGTFWVALRECLRGLCGDLQIYAFSCVAVHV